MFIDKMEEEQLGQLLHIPEPWYIDRVEFSLERKQLDVYVRVKEGCYFAQDAVRRVNLFMT